jgi:hypothetical protein
MGQAMMHEDSSFEDIGSEPRSRRAAWPAVGIVWEVLDSDDVRNTRTGWNGADRAHAREAIVLIIDDGMSDQLYTLPRPALIGCARPIGVDQYEERPVRGCSAFLRGGLLPNGIDRRDILELDGDWCLVSFVGGDWNKPVIIGWIPHPANVDDPGTGARDEASYLDQRGRSFERTAGVRTTVAPSGDTTIDRREAGRTLVPGAGGHTFRVPTVGGSLRHLMRYGQGVSLDWRDPAPTQYETQPNPRPKNATDEPKLPDAAYASMTDEIAEIVAGKVLRLMCRGGAGAVLVGGTPEDPPTEQAILGNSHAGTHAALSSFLSAFASAYNAHLAAHHAGEPPFAATVPAMPSADLSQRVVVK